MTLLGLFGIVLLCGVLAALVRGAPDSIVAEPFKTILVYLLLVVAVVAIVVFFFPGAWSAIANFHFGSR